MATRKAKIEKPAPAKHAGGRPSKYKPEYCMVAEAYSRLGWTDDQVAEKIGISKSTLSLWKVEHPELSEAQKRGKEEPDDTVERSLYERATGYVNKNAVKIFMPANAEEPVYAPYEEHVAPDVTAQIFWLKNRRPAKWRDKQEVEHSGTVHMFATPVDEKL